MSNQYMGIPIVWIISEGIERLTRVTQARTIAARYPQERLIRAACHRVVPKRSVGFVSKSPLRNSMDRPT